MQQTVNHLDHETWIASSKFRRVHLAAEIHFLKTVAFALNL